MAAKEAASAATGGNEWRFGHLAARWVVIVDQK